MTEHAWPPPEPRLIYGLYSYSCECPVCGNYAWSDKGMLGPETQYIRHWLRQHSGWNLVDHGAS